jgi:branched-chain amino acid transport system substrate-binding protein
MRTVPGILTLILLASAAFLPRAESATEPVRIAAIFAKTGIAAEENDEDFRGVRLACSQLNASGGLLGRPVILVEIDNRSTPLGSKQAAQAAIRNKVSAVIGADWSSHSLAMAPVLQAAGIPMIATVSTSPAITRMGDHIFRVCFIDTFQGKLIARFVRNDLGAETAAVMKMIDSDYSLVLAEIFRKAFEAGGGKVLWEGGYMGKSVDFSKPLRRIAERKPDILFLPGYERDSALIAKQAANMGLGVRIVGGDGWGPNMARISGNAMEGHYFIQHWHPELPFSENRVMQKFYKKQFGSDNDDDEVALAYDATMVLAEAVRRAGVAAPSAVREALAGIRRYRGVTGTFGFDENGDPVGKSAVVMRFQGGSAAYVKTFGPRTGSK